MSSGDSVEETHFGFASVPLPEKQSRVDQVFHNVAARYDLMNDLMSGGLHRLWKDRLVDMLNPSKTRAFRHIDVAGGTGDVAFRVARAGGAATQVTVLDINPDMLEIGRRRAAQKGLADKLAFVEANAESLPFPDGEFDAYTIAFGIRNVPRVDAALKEAYRVLRRGGRFLCLEFSQVDIASLDRLYRAYSFRAIPALGQIVTGDAEAYRYLVEFDPSLRLGRVFPQCHRCGRFFPRLVQQAERRDRGDLLGLEALGVRFPFGHMWRIARAGYVLSRAGLFSDIDIMALPVTARLPFGVAKLLAKQGGEKDLDLLPAAIGELGPSYVKLGQFLSTRPDVVGPEVALRLELLQDHMAPFSRELAVNAIETAFGRPIDTLFISFGEPVAAASIAQVHRARVRDRRGEREVAVKVLRPGVERRFRRDLSDMYFAAWIAERWFPETKRLKPVEVVATLARTVKIEMDFRLEAAAASEFAENTAGESDFLVPRVDWDRTEKEVLTLEWIEAIALSDTAALAVAGLDLPTLARTIIQSFLRHAVRDGFFHADMHQGNLFVDRQGRLIAVDFGIMGRLGLKERRFLAEIIYGFITRDYRRVAEVHFEAGYVPRRYKVEDFAQAIRAIGEPIHARTADQISMARVLTLLFEITALFDMKTRTELVLLQKTMVVVEGVARGLDPKLDMWSTAEPVVRSWIEKNLGPIGKIEDAGRGLAALGQFAAHLPAALVRAENIVTQMERMAEEGFELSEGAIEQIGQAEAHGARLGHFALWLIVVIMIFFLLR